MKYEEKIKLYGKPEKDQIYKCKIQHFKDKDFQEIDLIPAYADDHMWVTADDRSELNEMSWDVVEWVLK